MNYNWKYIEGDNGIRLCLPACGDEGIPVEITNIWTKPAGLGDFWLPPGEKITIAWIDGTWRATKPFMCIQHGDGSDE